MHGQGLTDDIVHFQCGTLTHQIVESLEDDLGAAVVDIIHVPVQSSCHLSVERLPQLTCFVKGQGETVFGDAPALLQVIGAELGGLLWH